MKGIEGDGGREEEEGERKRREGGREGGQALTKNCAHSLYTLS